jgi:hypothetical protein
MTLPIRYRIVGSPETKMKFINRGMTVRDVVAVIAQTVDRVSLDDTILEPTD